MKKKPRSLQELQHQRDHYLKILSGLNPDSAIMIRRQIDKLNRQIKTLENQKAL